MQRGIIGGEVVGGGEEEGQGRSRREAMCERDLEKKEEKTRERNLGREDKEVNHFMSSPSSAHPLVPLFSLPGS